ncbi:2-hydroxycarboxylate transporter family protein [Rhodococcus sp. BP-149]|nr:2-hydroxycarboxylate transporter family protein [Rhodococcus sp. BP-288]MBY6693406.1 2-hydroxycarboxylate transporter family protein [Rhodococcus sp. BP-188]MBY6697603.1 2-hydroxycarboxylate transporter family protein [Rhodococcus sp. BP-285]MBY6702280.1 2-hydroxycarboxylate transporter family protein [Rhodococcus sp. BP-283]MBY6709787.1 2-hydroxycarboxylate transporter family protein [Rhodococcus sp. BP-160]MBY6716833.1 2-hydroxycarboxylate transporter family protein [Rhodococcus sp. BP-11
MNATLGLPMKWFVPMAVVVVVVAYFFTPAGGMTAGFAVTMAIGGLLIVIGNAIPGFNRIGGGVILAIMVPAVLLSYNLIPESTSTAVADFYDLSAFGEFVVAALIVGSILGMDRQLLMKAGSRIIIPIIATITVCFALFGVIGQITGYGLGKMLFYVVGPVLGGGVAAGAIPISELIATNSGGSASDYLSLLVPAVVVANIVCIAAAGLLAFLGKRKPTMFKNFNGEGELAVGRSKLHIPGVGKPVDPADAVRSTIIGLFTAGALFMIADAISSFVPSIHSYVFLIVLCAAAKILLPLPDFLVQGADLWYKLVANAFIPAILVSVSIVAIDFQDVLALLADPVYMLSTVAVVIVALMAAGFVGWLIKLHFIESAISGGLGLADFGSSGDLAVLGAANRLELLPFLSISSRIGGGIVVLTLSLLGPHVL